MIPSVVGKDIIAFFEEALSKRKRIGSFGVAGWVVRAPAGHGGGFDELGDCYVVTIRREGWHFAQEALLQRGGRINTEYR